MHYSQHNPIDPLTYARYLQLLPIPAERRQIRCNANVSQSQLASALGVTPSAVRLWEMGERTPNPRVLCEYVDLLRELRRVSECSEIL